MIQTGSLMTTGEFPWSDRITLANDINEGLSYLHMKKIFHRDLTSKVYTQIELMFYFDENVTTTAKYLVVTIYLFSVTTIYELNCFLQNILIRISDITNAIRAVVADFGLATQIPNSDDEKLPQVGSPYW